MKKSWWSWMLVLLLVLASSGSQDVWSLSLTGQAQASEDAADENEPSAENDAKDATANESTAANDDMQDEDDPEMKVESDLQPWSYNMRRGYINILSPSATTLKKGDWYSRVMHVSQETYHGSGGYQNLFGLDESVKIGILVARGITDKLSTYIQRTNGRGVTVSPSLSVKMDYWDWMFKYQLMESQIEYIMDFSLLGGLTYMWRDKGGGSDLAYNFGFVVEKSVMRDKLRFGSGALFTTLSTYEGTQGLKEPNGADTKKLPDEYNTLFQLGGTNKPPPEAQTLGIPFNVSYALSQNCMIVAETVFPIMGYSTGHGAANALEFRFNSNTHEYNIYLTDTSNNSFNSTLTGGYRRTRLDIFGFSICSHF